MDVTVPTDQKEISESGKNEDIDVQGSLCGKVSKEKCSGSKAREACLNAAEGTSPTKLSSSNPGNDETGKETSRDTTGPAQSVNPSSQNVTIVMSPKSSGQKTQPPRFISQGQIASLPIHTIQLPLKSSPIILKATTIPMPTKTVSIVAKPSTSTSPVMTSSATAAVPSTSKSPSKAASGHKDVIGVKKRELIQSASSSKSRSFLHQKVKPGGVTKARMHSARVIVVPLQVTKEMIAVKQKAAKMVTSAASDAGKRVKKLSSKAENVFRDDGNGDFGIKGKNPGKQIKKSAVAKKTEDNEATKIINLKSKSQGKASGKESKKLGSGEFESETEDIESETTTLEKLQKMSKDDKDGTGGIEKFSMKGSSKETKKREEEKEEECDLEVDSEEIIKVGKKVKGRVGNKNSDDAADETEVKSPEKMKKKAKIADSKSEMDTDSKSKSERGKTPKKGMKKEKDDEEAHVESDLNPKGRGKAAKKSQRKNESEDEAKITSESESKQDDDDDDDDDDVLDVKLSRKKKAKKVKEEKDKEEERSDDDSEVDDKKTPGRPRKLKGEPSSSLKPKEEPVLSTRRSKRESNLSVKLAEWGLVPVASKASHLKLATPKSPVASLAVSVSKHSAGARSSLASGSPVTANSPGVSSEDVSSPASPGKPSVGVTVSVIKPGTDSMQAAAISDAGSSQSSKTLASNANEKQPAKSSMVQFDKGSSNLSASNITRVVPKVTPKVVKAEKSTTGQSVKQVAKVTQEKAIVFKPVMEMKQLQNKSLMCKPIMMTKATSCNPIRIHKITQTEVPEAGRRKKTLFVPVPVPIAMPSPVATCALPTPFPLPLPVPLPVPCFIPSSRKSIEGLMKSLQELHDQMPSDPFEMDLLTMAEAVTNAHSEVPDCIIEPDEVKPILKLDPNIGVAATTAQCQTSGGELSEDVLEMALLMAQEMPEEGSFQLEVLKGRVANHPEASQTTEFGSIVRNGGIQHKRPAGDTERGSYKRLRPETSGGGLCVHSTAVAFAKALPMKDLHTKLKYSCGVKAWKHWVKEKNVELEKAAAALKIRSKLFKYEILQCSTEELNLALSLFVREVRKPTGEEYAPDTIYYLCLGIQYYLFENGRVDNIFSDVYYNGFSDTLNNLLSAFQIRLNPQGIIICRITEEHLWESRQLGAHSPYVLLSTLVYLNTKYFMLNSTDAHLALMFANVVKLFKKNGISSDVKQTRTAFLRYNSAVYTDVNRQKSIGPPVNPLEQLENPDNPLRCPVKLYEFYLSKCPENIRSRSELFYLTPEISSMPNSSVWYNTIPVSSEVMSKILGRFQVVREIQEAILHNMQPVFG